MRTRPPKIKITVPKAGFLTGVGIRIHLQRQRVCGGLHVEGFDAHLDMARWKGVVDGFVTALQHRAGYSHDRFQPRRFDSSECVV